VLIQREGSFAAVVDVELAVLHPVPFLVAHDPDFERRPATYAPKITASSSLFPITGFG
jgi:hypothetical protein